MPIPPCCARHSTACACAHCAADESSSSRAMCSTLRPVGEIVHDEARNKGARYSASAAWAVASLPAGSASADGTSVGKKARGRGLAGREAAGGVHLPLRCLVLSELPTVFGPLLRRAPARARLLRFRFGCAAPALPVFVLDGPVGAAQQELRDNVGFAIARGRVQRRVPARQTAAGTRPAHSADSPQRKRRTRKSRWPGRSRRRWHRRAIGGFGDCRWTPHGVAR
jgi:hypothetical protein